jgi:hypothetical protein
MRLTFTSSIKHWLGCALIGTPESMSLPNDYYFEKSDREKPTAEQINTTEEQKVRISTDAFRRDHRWRLCKLISALWAALLVLLIVVIGIFAGGASWWNKPKVNTEVNTPATQAQDDAKLLSRCAMLTLNQQAADSDCAAMNARLKAQRAAQEQ